LLINYQLLIYECSENGVFFVDRGKKGIIAAGVIAALALYLVFAIIMVKSGLRQSIILYPGCFLYIYYLDSAFYVPAYLLACSFFLIWKSFRKENLIVLVLTIIPFLTTGIALRLLYLETEGGWLEKSLTKSFGTFAPLVVFLVALIEIMLVIKAGIYLSAGKNSAGSSSRSEDHGTEEIDAEETGTEVPGAEQSEEGAAHDNYAEVSPASSGFAELSLDHSVYDEPAYFRMAKNKSVLSEEIAIEADKGNSGIDNKTEPEYRFAEELEEELEEEPAEEFKDAVIIPEAVDPEVYEEIAGEAAEESDADASADTLAESDMEERPVVVKEYFAALKNIVTRKKSYDIPFDILDEYQETGFTSIDARTKDESEILRQTLAEFKIEAEVTGIRKGPVITMFEILPAPGVKLSRITNLADNIALRLAASRVRIVAPIPGKHAVGIEVPNRKRAIVSFRELISVDYPQYEKYHLPIVLGKDITGEEQIIDLTQTPHLLIAGATGSGKSVCVNSIIASLLYKRKPQDVRMILIDPKIVELKLYNDIPHLLTPVITDPKKAFQALQYCIYEMEKRYALLDALGVRDIHSFNRKIKSKNIATLPLPYIVVIVDEFADLMATTGKELESTLARLAAMSRAVGIHLVLATQRPSIDVITGLIKANIPSRIAFMVASKTDSRIIIDSTGAEMLLGKGDMLFTSAWNPYLTRIQGAYLSESEAERVAEKVREYGEPEYIDDEIFFDDDDEDIAGYDTDYGVDPLMEKALEIVATAGKASASYLQRRLKIGYNRAARLVEEMERRGIVGPQNGSKPRDILSNPNNYRE